MRYSPDSQPAPTGMGKCCGKCKTPYGHSALAGTCCHGKDKKG